MVAARRLRRVFGAGVVLVPVDAGAVYGFVFGGGVIRPVSPAGTGAPAGMSIEGFGTAVSYNTPIRRRVPYTLPRAARSA